MHLKSLLGALILISSSYAALTREDLQDMGDRYVRCLRNIGNPDTPFPSQELDGLLDEACVKVENCHQIAGTLQEIKEQLNRAISHVGQPWIIGLVRTFLDVDAQTCILQFKVKTKIMNPHTTMAVLTVDPSKRRITSINEVFAPVSMKEILS